MSESGWVTCEVCGVGLNVERAPAWGEAMMVAFVEQHAKKHAKEKAKSRSASPSSAALP